MPQVQPWERQKEKKNKIKENKYPPPNKQSKLIEKESRFVVTRDRGGESWGNGMKRVDRYKPAVIRSISTRGVRYHLVSIVNSAVCYRWKLLRE